MYTRALRKEVTTLTERKNVEKIIKKIKRKLHDS